MSISFSRTSLLQPQLLVGGPPLFPTNSFYEELCAKLAPDQLARFIWTRGGEPEIHDFDLFLRVLKVQSWGLIPFNLRHH